MEFTVLSYQNECFHQNESCLLALSVLHNSGEDGGKQGSSHFDEKLSFLIGHYSKIIDGDVSIPS